MGRPGFVERTARSGLYLAAALMALFLAVLLVWLVRDTARLLAAVGVVPVALGLSFTPLAGHYGLLPFAWGSAVVGAVALAASVPLGIGFAVAVTKRLPTWAGSGLTSGMTAVVAVPSVIWGWWGLATVVPWLRGATGGPGFSLLAAGVTAAVMVVPTVAALAAGALGQVAPELEDASRALGATEDQTLWAVTMRAAQPGLVQASLMGLGRAVAETMAVAMVVGGQAVARIQVQWPGSTLTTGILGNMAAWPPDSPGGQAVGAMALVLLIGTWWLLRQLHRVGATP